MRILPLLTLTVSVTGMAICDFRHNFAVPARLCLKNSRQVYASKRKKDLEA